MKALLLNDFDMVKEPLLLQMALGMKETGQRMNAMGEVRSML